MNNSTTVHDNGNGAPSSLAGLSSLIVSPDGDATIRRRVDALYKLAQRSQLVALEHDPIGNEQ